MFSLDKKPVRKKNVYGKSNWKIWALIAHTGLEVDYIKEIGSLPNGTKSQICLGWQNKELIYKLKSELQ